MEDAALINPLPYCGCHVAGEKLYVCNEVFLLNVMRINPLPDYDCYIMIVTSLTRSCMCAVNADKASSLMQKMGRL